MYDEYYDGLLWADDKIVIKIKAKEVIHIHSIEKNDINNLCAYPLYNQDTDIKLFK